MVLLIRGNVVQSLTQYNAVPDGNVASPGLSFAHASTTGVSRSAEGNVVISVGGTAAMEVSTEGITANAFVGDGAGVSNVAAANVTGLTAALDVIDASSVSSNVFVGDGSGLSNIAAANVTGLTAALDVIDASSVSSNVVYGGTSGDLQIGANLVPTSNVAFNLGTELLRFKDLFLAGNTIDLGGSLIQSVLGNVVIGNLDVTNIRGDGSGLTGMSIPPSINTITITDSSWNPIDDLALSTSSTGYVTIQGNNFEPVGTTVSVGGTAASSITFVDSITLRVSVNPKTTGTYDVVVQTGGGSVTKVNGVSFDPLPVWSTGSSLGNVYDVVPFSIPLSASDGASAITYSNTSALPPSTTLASNGLLAGNITLTSSTTYNFSVEAIDAQNQSSLRTFSLNAVYALLQNHFPLTYANLLVEGRTYSGSGTTWQNAVSSPVVLALNNSPSFSSTFPGYFSFDGTSQNASVANWNNGSGAWVHSVAAWVRFPTTTSNGRLFYAGYNGTNQSTRLDINHQSTPPGVVSSFYSNNVKWDYTFSPNTWYFIVFTYDGGSQAATNRKLFVNGVSISGAGSGGGAGTGNLNIPANLPLSVMEGLGTYLHADLAFFATWSNHKLTPTEVTDAWSSTKGYFGYP
jgi:hypothetical protein